MLTTTALLLSVLFPQGGELLELKVGVPVDGEITAEDPEVRDQVIVGRGLWLPLRSRRYRFRPAETGRFGVELGAELFATFVVVRDAEGTPIVWEHIDNGILTADLVAGTEYAIDCAATLGATGSFRVVLHADSSGGLSDQTAVERARMRLDVRRQHFGEDHLQVAAALDWLGFLLYLQSDYRGARPCMERALAIWEHVYGDAHAMTAYGHSQLAAQLGALGELERARSEQEACLAIRRAALGESHPDALTTQNHLGVIAQQQGRLDDAERRFRHALDQADEHRSTSAEFRLQSRTNLAYVLNGQGKHTSARATATEAIAEAERVFGEGDVRVGHALNTLASIENQLGHFSRAESLHRRALALRRRSLPPGHRDTATSLNNLAVVLDNAGKLDEAQPFFSDCLETYRQTLGEHWWVAVVQGNLGHNLTQQGRVEEGERHLREALALLDRLGLARHRAAATTTRYLGEAALHTGRWTDAERLFREAVALHTDALGPRHPDTLKSRMYLGHLLLRCGRSDEAMPVYRQTVDDLLRAHGPHHPDVAVMTEGLGIAQRSLGLHDEAFGSCISAVRARWHHLGGELIVASSEDRFRQAADLESTLQFLLSLLRERPDAAAVDAAFAWQAACRGIVFRHALRERDQARAHMSEEAAALLDELELTRARLSKLAYATGVEDPEAHAARIAALDEQKHELERKLGQLLDITPLDEQIAASDLAARLPGGSALLDFRFHRELRFSEIIDETVTPEDPRGRRLLAWIVRAGADHAQLLDLGDAEPIELAVEAYIRELVANRSRPRRGAQERAPNDVLRELLWDPIAGALAGAKLVFVTAHGELAKVPLGTIQLADDRYLIEDRSFVFVQDPISLDLLLQRGAPERESVPTLLALGGVDYEAETTGPEGEPAAAEAALLRDGFGDYWRSLPETLGEVEALCRLHGRRFAATDRLRLTGAAATKARLVADASRFDVLHLATHGFFEPAGLPSLWEQALAEARESGNGAVPDRRRALTGYPPGLLAGLVLAGANRETDRELGILTAEETIGLDLRGCELVVLSACQTALGEMKGGEGMLSLRRAFHQAGARTVVSSLWSVRDDATSRLMRSFYTNLWEHGRSPLDALRGAQLEMLELNRRRHDGEGMPSTWGAFVLSGEWR